MNAIEKRNRIAYLRNALHELQVIQGENNTDDIANALEDTRKELDRLEPPCMQCGEPSTTTHEGTPVCNECLAYFLDKSERRRYDYTDSATANDMRFGSDSEGF